MNIKNTNSLLQYWNKKDNLFKMNTYLIITIFIFTSINYFLYNNSISNMLIFSIFLLLNLILLSFMNYKNKIINILFMISFFIKSIYAYNLFINGHFPFNDSLTYLTHLDAMKYGNGIKSFGDVYNVAQSLHVGYHYFIFIIDLIFKNKYALYMSNIIMFQASVVLFLNYLKDKKLNKQIINITICFSLISFNMVIFTSNILKDSLVLFMTILSIYLYNKYTIKKEKKYILGLTVSLVILFITRIYTGVALTLAIIVDYILNYNTFKKNIYNIKFNKKFILISSSIIISVVILIKYTGIWMYIDAIRISLESSFTNIPLLVIGTIKELVRTFISPLPWNALDKIDVYSITAIDSTLAIVFGFTLLMFIVKFLKFKELRKLTYIYIIPIFIQASILGITYNEGSVRQRIAIFLFIPLLYCIGYFYNYNKPDKGIYENDIDEIKHN